MNARTVHVTWAGERRFDAGIPSAPQIHMDGHTNTGPNPVDTLLSAVGACAGIDVVEILAKRRTPVSSLNVTVVGERVETVPRRIKHITLQFVITGTSLDRSHVERAVELSVTKYCSVRDSLREDIGVDWTIDLRDA